MSYPERVAEIDPSDVLVGDDRLGTAGCEHATALDYVCTIDKLEQLARIVIRDEHADAAIRQVANERCDFFDGIGIDAGEWFVE
jgi:hypothetical protein